MMLLKELIYDFFAHHIIKD